MPHADKTEVTTAMPAVAATALRNRRRDITGNACARDRSVCALKRWVSGGRLTGLTVVAYTLEYGEGAGLTVQDPGPIVESLIND